MRAGMISTFAIMKNTFPALNGWGFPSDVRPIVIAGPCSAENREQMLITAEGLKNSGVHALRAGIWKPRTRPGSFSGVGDEGLQWLIEAGQETGLPVTTEVARPAQAEAALKAGVNFLWIGARTTVNPFLVQEIADTLIGIDIPVLVKNPVNPDIDLWTGAVERLMKSGIKNIAAVHRGFSSYENSNYRNKPNWEIPIEMKRRFPDMLMFCDPSHICGNRFMLAYISQVAMDLRFDGLMIESHFNPGIALTDSAQQITPADLADLISKLQIRKSYPVSAFELSRLEDLRDQIDEIDDDIVKVIADRMEIARQIGDYKLHNNIAILQPERWEEIIRTRTENGLSRQLSAGFMKKLYSIIHEESILQQTGRMSEENANSKLNPLTDENL